MGDKLDPAKAKSFPAGSFAIAPAKMNHFAFTKQGAVVEVVNPADDPSETASKSPG